MLIAREANGRWTLTPWANVCYKFLNRLKLLIPTVIKNKSFGKILFVKNNYFISLMVTLHRLWWHYYFATAFTVLIIGYLIYTYIQEGGVGIFGFSVFAIFFASTSVFRFCCGLRFPGFPFLASGFRFLAEIKRFSDFGDRCAFLVFLIQKEVKDRLVQAPNVVFVVLPHYQLPSSYIFALKSISFRDLPLLQHMIGGLLKIVFRGGRFSLTPVYVINVFLRSCTAW